MKSESASRLRILMLEDNPADEELVLLELRRAGIDADTGRVSTREAFEAQLDRRPDAILSDYQLPQWTGLDALQLVRGRGLQVPFIIVSGTVGDELAVEAMRQGADDYLLKDRLSRLGAALMQALERKQLREEAQASEERFRAMFEKAAVGITHTDLEGRFVMANPKFCEITGYSAEEVPSLGFRDVLHPDEVQKSIEFRARLLEGSMAPYEREVRLVRKDRSVAWVNVTTSVVRASERLPPHFISVLHDISERKRAEHELQQFRMAMDISVDSIYLTDPGTMRFVYLNNTACKRLGYSREELLQRGPQDALALTREQIRREYDEVIAAGDRGLRQERRFVRSDGTKGWTELHRQALRTEGGTLIVTIGRDITERRKQQRKIERLSRVYAVLSGINALIVRVRDRAELFKEACRIAVDSGKFPLAWVAVADGRDQRVRAAAWAGDEAGFVQLHRPTFGASGRGKPGLGAQAVAKRAPVICNDIEADGSAMRYPEQALARGYRSAAALPLLVDGTATAALVLYASEAGFFDAEETKLLAELAGDISFALDHIEKEQRLDYLAYYDSLTGIANRTLFIERLKQNVHAALQTGSKVALVLADVERLRTINESLGRQAGDALLKQVAERLVRAADATEVGRIGADQFAIMLPSVKGKSQVARTVEKLSREWLGKLFRLDDAELRIAAKAGITLFPNDGADAETLLRNAEAALIQAKESGERHTFYTAALTHESAERLSLENRLRQALEKDEFVLHYQPKVDLERRRIVGVEALIRWQNPERGMVPPGEFIPLMEETGLILDVGAWALTRAVADHVRWLEQGLAAPRVAVNVSAIQLRRRQFLGSVQEVIRQGATPPGIDLEITESLLMEDVESTIEKLKAIRDLGMSIAIDDFGTGYSSLGYLAKLPAHSLKIDRSFIVRMVDDRDTMTLVQTIISLAQSLRLKVVAEGVDSEDQAKLLRLLRCDEMQGYLFSRPLPFDAMTTLLRNENGRARRPS